MEMMKYVEDYFVSALIVKDLFKLGREYSYMGHQQDFIFPAYDVRFIAVNDDVDSAKGENDFAVGLCIAAKAAGLKNPDGRQGADRHRL